MMSRKLHRAVALIAVCTSTVASPAESYGCFDWLFGCCRRPTTAYYAPVAAPACQTCASPVVAAPACQTCSQVCNYVPQTCYRTNYVSVPVTSYRPVCAVDPCTGCPRTAMQPVTTYMMQAQSVPVTTYRPVMSTVCSYAPAATAVVPSSPCSTCGTAPAVYTPTYQTSVAPAPAAGACCGQSGTTIAPGLPGATVPSLSTPAVTSPPVLTAPPTTTITPTPEPALQPTTTFQSSSLKYQEPAQPAAPQLQQRDRVPPAPNYNFDDRTTSNDRSHAILTASTAAPVKSSSIADDSGWRAAR